MTEKSQRSPALVFDFVPQVDAIPLDCGCDNPHTGLIHNSAIAVLIQATSRAAKLAGTFRAAGFSVGSTHLRTQPLYDLRDSLAQKDNLLDVSGNRVLGIESRLREFGKPANSTKRIVDFKN